MEHAGVQGRETGPQMGRSFLSFPQTPAGYQASGRPPDREGGQGLWKNEECIEKVIRASSPQARVPGDNQPVTETSALGGGESFI